MVDLKATASRSFCVGEVRPRLGAGRPPCAAPSPHTTPSSGFRSGPHPLHYCLHFQLHPKLSMLKGAVAVTPRTPLLTVNGMGTYLRALNAAMLHAHSTLDCSTYYTSSSVSPQTGLAPRCMQRLVRGPATNPSNCMMITPGSVAPTNPPTPVPQAVLAVACLVGNPMMGRWRSQGWHCSTCAGVASGEGLPGVSLLTPAPAATARFGGGAYPLPAPAAKPTTNFRLGLFSKYAKGSRHQSAGPNRRL